MVIGDILEVEGRETESQIAETGGRVSFVQLDVTSEEDWRNAVQFAISNYGKLDVLVNNAGISSRTGVEETSACMGVTSRMATSLCVSSR